MTGPRLVVIVATKVLPAASDFGGSVRVADGLGDADGLEAAGAAGVAVSLPRFTA